MHRATPRGHHTLSMALLRLSCAALLALLLAGTTAFPQDVQVDPVEGAESSSSSSEEGTLVPPASLEQPQGPQESLEEEVTTAQPACGCVCGVPNQRTRIVGGNATQPHEFPWIVALAKRNVYGRDSFYCGATLVTRKHLVTAAHCIDGFNLKDISAYMGIHKRAEMERKGALRRKLVKAHVHSGFALRTFDNDIAVLEMESEVDLGEKVRTACLPISNDEDYTGRSAVVAGWGRLGERSETATVLQKVIVPVMGMDECRESGYGKSRITDNMICAGYKQGKKDGCQGDSGGPMHVPTDGTTELIGVVSWGRGCARPNYPGVYTRVANYLDWVKSKLGDECLCPRP